MSHSVLDRYRRKVWMTASEVSRSILDRCWRQIWGKLTMSDRHLLLWWTWWLSSTWMKDSCMGSAHLEDQRSASCTLHMSVFFMICDVFYSNLLPAHSEQVLLLWAVSQMLCCCCCLNDCAMTCSRSRCQHGNMASTAGIAVSSCKKCIESLVLQCKARQLLCE